MVKKGKAAVPEYYDQIESVYGRQIEAAKRNEEHKNKLYEKTPRSSSNYETFKKELTLAQAETEVLIAQKNEELAAVNKRAAQAVVDEAPYNLTVLEEATREHRAAVDALVDARTKVENAKKSLGRP